MIRLDVHGCDQAKARFEVEADWKRELEDKAFVDDAPHLQDRTSSSGSNPPERDTGTRRRSAIAEANG